MTGTGIKSNGGSMAKANGTGIDTVPRLHALIFGAAVLLAWANLPPPAYGSDTAQQTFTSPEQAVDALVAATGNNDAASLKKILGPDSEQLVNSGDPVADKEWRAKFTATYAKNHKLEKADGGKIVLAVGKEEWPFPIPLVQQDQSWRFDTQTGEEEILARRIGRNELSAIEVCRAFADAQYDYASEDRNGTGYVEYAQKIVSSPGKHDGLYWDSAPDDESPIGPLMASARAEGYDANDTQSERAPYHGYYYKILTRQGEHASGGARDYIVKGHMIGGFATVAFPATYGDSGVMTFIVNQDGVVYEKNLGPDTAQTAGQMTEFDPDPSWTKSP